MASKFSAEVMDTLAANAPINLEKATTIAAQFDLKPKSVIAATVRAGIAYERKARVSSKTGEAPVTKEELVVEIAEATGFTVEELNGLEKASKIALQNLAAFLKQPERDAYKLQMV